MIKIKSEEIKKKNLKFVGSVTEEEAKKLSKECFCLFTKSETDLIGDVFGNGHRSVYVYKKDVSQNKGEQK